MTELLQALQGNTEFGRESVHLVDDDDAEAAGLGHHPRGGRPLRSVIELGCHALVGVLTARNRRVAWGSGGNASTQRAIE
jgi:hypothetical protein